MKIAQIAPLWETVPPKAYGGTELVIYNLVTELANLGHEVTLYTTADSEISHPNITLIPMQATSLREQGISMGSPEGMMAENEMIAKVVEDAKQFDIIHNHLGHQFLPFADLLNVPVVTTLHGSFQSDDFCEFARKYPHQPLVSISYAQRVTCPDLGYVGNVYHGLDLEKFSPRFDTPIKGKDSYLAFLGRFSPEKGPLEAIQIAKATGYNLILSGKINDFEQDYFNQEIAPLIDNQQIRFIGEVNHDEKVDLLRNAAAMLFPISWPEPFGLVMIEAMACGTPVIALQYGSVPEVISQDVSGFYANTIDELIDVVKQLERFDRRSIRKYTDINFSRRHMAESHLDIYRSLTYKAPQSEAFLHLDHSPRSEKKESSTHEKLAEISLLNKMHSETEKSRDWLLTSGHSPSIAKIGLTLRDDNHGNSTSKHPTRYTYRF